MNTSGKVNKQVFHGKLQYDLLFKILRILYHWHFLSKKACTSSWVRDPWVTLKSVWRHPEASGGIQKASENVKSRPEAPACKSLSTKDTLDNILPHFCWNADSILQSSSHIFLKMSTAKKCSFLRKTSFHCFCQSKLSPRLSQQLDLLLWIPDH